MSGRAVGISDMALFVPESMIQLDTILKKRSEEDPGFERRLRRAIESTAQEAIRFPKPWQDSVTLAAQASRELLEREPSRAPSVRYFAVGTETSVDMSKPIAAYAQGVLQRSGVPVPDTMSTFQVQHACAGGTIGLASVSALLQAGGRDGESGLVVCSDVARYDTPSTAEITQGAGAVAMLVEEDPDLLELDLGTIGVASHDVDDFFRPLNSITARVKGRFSVDCYNEALDEAFRDHAVRLGAEPADILKDTDIFVLHVPFYKMAVSGMAGLLKRYLELTSEEIDSFLKEKGFIQALEASRVIGNIYSGSAYMALMYSLEDRFQTFGDDIVGKRVILASYGSGNTMMIVGGRITSNAPAVLSRWNLQAILDSAEETPFGEYETWVQPRQYDLSHGPVETDGVSSGDYYLANIREDGYREYFYQE